MWTKPGPRLKKFEASRSVGLNGPWALSPEAVARCKDTSSGGLIANVNCFFPHLSGESCPGYDGRKCVWVCLMKLQPPISSVEAAEHQAPQTACP